MEFTKMCHYSAHYTDARDARPDELVRAEFREDDNGHSRIVLASTEDSCVLCIRQGQFFEISRVPADMREHYGLPGGNVILEYQEDHGVDMFENPDPDRRPIMVDELPVGLIGVIRTGAYIEQMKPRGDKEEERVPTFVGRPGLLDEPTFA